MVKMQTKIQNYKRVEKAFDKSLEQLDLEGHRIITLAENARLRIQEGINSDISRNGNYTREGFLYVPGQPNKLVRKSPILDSPVEATQAHRYGNEFYISQEQLEQVIGSGFYELQDKTFYIPTNRFKEEGLTVFAFGTTEGKNLNQDQRDAEEYGLFLKEAGIKEMPVWLVDRDYVNRQKGPFARQLWFDGLDSGSSLNGDDWGLNCDCRVLGVPKEAGEGMQKSLELYSIQDIKRVLKAKGLTGLEKVLIDGIIKSHEIQ